MRPRPIIDPRLSDFEEMVELLLDIGALFAVQDSWVYLASRYSRYYPSLVQEFYGNLNMRNDRLYTIVKGVEIMVNPALFEKALGVSTRGADMIFGHGDVEETFMLMTYCEYIEGVSNLITPNSNYFPPLQRILHHMFTTLFYPKAGSRNEVTEVHRFLFCHVMNGVTINMGCLMTYLVDSCRTQ